MTRRNWDLWALAALLVAGAGLRLALMMRWRPGFLGYPDSSAYLAGVREPFADNMRPQGYPWMLDLVGVVSPNLSFATLVQHGLGLATAILLFVFVRLVGAPRWAGLIPAAVISLTGAQIFVEHAILAESWFVFQIALAITLAAGATRLPADLAWLRWVMIAAAGLVLGVSATLRAIGVFLLPLLAVYLIAMLPGGWRARVGGAAATAACFVVVLIGFMSMHDHATGKFALTENQFYNYYGRVSGFVECEKFDRAPAGANYLCPAVARAERYGHDWWLFDERSPFRAELGKAYNVSPTDEQSAEIRAFVRQAIKSQPGAYVNAVLRDLARVIDPSFPRNPDNGIGNTGGGLGPDELAAIYKNKDWTTISLYQHVGFTADQYGVYKGFAALETYERIARWTGLRMIVLLLLALAGPLLAIGARQRAGALLALGNGLVLIVVPVLIAKYDFRFTIPAYGPLAVSAAIAVAGAATRLQTARRSRAAEPGPATSESTRLAHP